MIEDGQILVIIFLLVKMEKFMKDEDGIVKVLIHQDGIMLLMV
jgi:hypothetical protein